jgi:hypothetical protein
MIALGHILRALGVRSAQAVGDDKGATHQLKLYLQRPGHGRVLVGSLWKRGDRFVFEYADDFAHANLPPLPDFPVTDRQYESPDLWPFFLVRLPPADRPDVQRVIKDRGLEPDDTLGILGKLGRKAVSFPYELEFAA